MDSTELFEASIDRRQRKIRERSMHNPIVYSHLMLLERGSFGNRLEMLEALVLSLEESEQYYRKELIKEHMNRPAPQVL